MQFKNKLTEKLILGMKVYATMCSSFRILTRLKGILFLNFYE
jgi:hypothetical protein